MAERQKRKIVLATRYDGLTYKLDEMKAKGIEFDRDNVPIKRWDPEVIKAIEELITEHIFVPKEERNHRAQGDVGLYIDEVDCERALTILRDDIHYDREYVEYQDEKTWFTIPEQG